MSRSRRDGRGSKGHKTYRLASWRPCSYNCPVCVPPNKRRKLLAAAVVSE